MDILKTIPAIPEKTDVTHKVSIMSMDFLAKTVTFNIVIGIGIGPENTFPKTVSFAEVTAIVTAPQKNTFVLVIRTALSIAMGVDISKIPLDIFSVSTVPQT